MTKNSEKPVSKKSPTPENDVGHGVEKIIYIILNRNEVGESSFIFPREPKCTLTAQVPLDVAGSESEPGSTRVVCEQKSRCGRAGVAASSIIAVGMWIDTVDRTVVCIGGDGQRVEAGIRGSGMSRKDAQRPRVQPQRRTSRWRAGGDLL
ncbi:hypothetical protein B0H19DRAFT_1234299 [Mycena capillaripes]|nr:hypothetical protein B0H19DRAFT_1234299 [Mycena capillaripes]